VSDTVTKSSHSRIGGLLDLSVGGITLVELGEPS
jgi:hypothetical protein